MKEKKYTNTYNSIENNILNFYKDINTATFNGLTARKILELKFEAKKLNRLFNNKDFNELKSIRYTKIMNRIRCTPKNYNIEKPIEKFILFMFSVDPDFESVIIYGECNTVKEIKSKLLNYYGLYDPFLIKIEKAYIKHFLSENKKKKIDEEIQKRVFK